MGVSRKTFSAAMHGLEPDLKLPDLDLPGRKGEPPRGQAEFVQTPGDYIREATIARLAERGKKLAAEHRATLAAIEQKFGVPPQRRSWRSGAARPPMAATSCRTTPSACWRRRAITAAARTGSARNSSCAEDPGGGPRQARRHAQLLGRRDGADAVPAVGVLQARRRFRRRRPPQHLDLGAGRARLGRAAARQQGLAARQALGLRGARAGAMSTAPSACRSITQPVGEWLERGYRADAWPPAEPAGARRACLAAAAGRHLRAGLPHAQELLRDQGVQFLRSLRAVRRPSSRPHRRSARRSRRPGARTRSCAPPRSRRCSARSPSSASTRTRSTARPEC